MALQKVFKKSYMAYLRENIKVDDYLQDSFPYDKEQCVQIAGVIAPDYDLLDKLDPSPDGDLQSAIALFEAYPDLSPIFAQQDDLWIYLSHADLFEYVQKRWPNLHSQSDPENYVILHWFRGQFLLRTTFAGLWWSVYLTHDKSRTDPFELTRILFSNAELRTNSFGALPLIRHREAMIGVLEFLKDHPDLLKDGLNARARYIQKLFEILGGSKNLSYLDRSFFKNELSKRYDIIAAKHAADDVKGQLEI